MTVAADPKLLVREKIQAIVTAIDLQRRGQAAGSPRQVN